MPFPKIKQPLPGVLPEMLRPTFWTARFQDLGLEEDWIGNSKYLPELAVRDYLANIDRVLEELYNEDGTQFTSEKFITRFNFWERPEYGLMVGPGDLKLIPQEVSLFSNKGESDLDRNQLSGLDPGDMVTTFGISSDGKWFGISSDVGVGWVKRELVGVGSRKEIENYLNEPDQLIAVDPSPQILTNAQLLGASMGCRFPLNDKLRQTVIVPGRSAKGSLEWKIGLIPWGAVRGHLPKVIHHLIRQSFKYLGCDYAWGDRDREGDGRDCSRLVRDVLRSLGFNPPRNSREQLVAGRKRVEMAGMDINQRLAGLKKVSPGSLLFTAGHVMIFLGEYQGEVYAIHALNNYRRIVDNKEETAKVKQVVVSTLTLGSGTSTGSLLEQITEVIEV